MFTSEIDEFDAAAVDGYFGGKAGGISFTSATCSSLCENISGWRSSSSSSSNELLLELVGSDISFNVDCSGSEESNSIELLSVESFHVHGELPRHSEAVWYDDERDGANSDAVTKDSSSVVVDDFKLEFQSYKNNQTFCQLV